jgi:hypothetical protein
MRIERPDLEKLMGMTGLLVSSLFILSIVVK